MSDEVLRDLLRERGLTEAQLDDVVRWARAPDAVRHLLSHTPRFCPDCGVEQEQAHLITCEVATAWLAIGDPRGERALLDAHDEANHQAMMTPSQRAQVFNFLSRALSRK